MKVLITGGTGLIGSKLTEELRDRGDEVIIASRSREGKGFIQWDPYDANSLTIPDGTDAVVHLAGAPVFGQRWNDDYKKEIRRSRVQGTRTVIQAIRQYEGDLSSFVSSSAVGYYGDQDDKKLIESSDSGDDFLAEVCVQWEKPVKKFADEEGSPATSIIRTGIVLSMEDGALKRMLNPVGFIWPFHWGLGGPLGSGQHFMPWIHIDDEIGAILHLLDNDSEGIYNLSAPNPARNRDFVSAIGSVLNRPTIFPIPYFALRLLFGPAASILFASQRVYPEALQEDGYEFQFEEPEDALEDLIG